MADFKVPLIVRGEIIEDYEVDFADRSGAGRSFTTPDVGKYISKVVTTSPAVLEDLYTLRFDDIVDFLCELGQRLDIDTNPYWREAYEVSCHASNLSQPVLEFLYRTTPAKRLSAAAIREVADVRIGIPYLEGWVRTRLADGRSIEVRALGARSAHVIAGNMPGVAVGTLLRSAITRHDAIIKLPSNDPLTMSAIARTMIDIDPSHPLTRHLTVGYWKGGDEKVEGRIYRPEHIEKLVAWGGFASIKHISRYLQPGIDLVTLDPKSSTTLIGREAFADETVIREVARRAAADLGGWDQEACVNARVLFIETGTNPEGIATANRFGEMLFEAVQDLPSTISNGPSRFDPELRSELEALRHQDDFFKLITRDGQLDKTGAVIVSQFSEQVDFPKLLYGRVGNVVPVDDIEDAFRYFSAWTQTVGFYPDALRAKLRDRAAIMGGQMLVPLGYAIMGSLSAPQDGIEPERRMCRWIVDTHATPEDLPGPWEHQAEIEERRSARLVASSN